MVKRNFYLRLFALTLLALFTITGLYAQCNQADFSNINISGVAVTEVTCPQNGSIIVNGASGGGGVYTYEIYAGPLVRGLQTQKEFHALLPGTYSLRVIGCNGKFIERNVTVVNSYLDLETPSLRIINAKSFKCNTVNSGKVVLTMELNLPHNSYADSVLYSFPLRYQVSTNNDPLTGFTESPFLEISNTGLMSYPGNFKTIKKYDTISGLSASTTYFIKVMDQCGAYKTVSLNIPEPQNSPLSYSFAVREPYLLNADADHQMVKANCIQWGELTISVDEAPISTLPGNNSFAPIKAVLKRLDNNQIIATRNFTRGTFYKSGNRNLNNDNNLVFDSIPRVPVRLEITDQCGTITIIENKTPSINTPLKIAAFTKCNSSTSYFYVKPINGSPSLPMRFRIYDHSNHLITDKLLIDINYQQVYLPGMSTLCCNQLSTVPAYGRYHIVMEDQCGNKDSVVHQFQPENKQAAVPVLVFTSYQTTRRLPGGKPIYSVGIVNTGDSQLGKIAIYSGPAVLPFLKLAKPALQVSAGHDELSLNRQYFDSLQVGTYKVKVAFGCSQVLDTSFTISTSPPLPMKGTLSINLQSNECSAFGNTVTGNATISGADPNFALTEQACIRISQAPTLFLQSAAVYKNGLPIFLPLDLGNFNAVSSKGNGIDTNSVASYPLFTFEQLTNGFYRLPAGNYTFQFYGKNSNALLDSKSFTIEDAGYSSPNLGASAGYICDGGIAKIVIRPIGGRGSFMYQVKLASDPNPLNYTALQTDNNFNLPATTKQGTVYSIRTIDECNNSFVGQVVVSSFADTFYIAYSNDCVGYPSRIITGFVPGATYTWTNPAGTIVITNSNELYIPVFSATDIGTYKVSVNALDACIVRGSSTVIGVKCNRDSPVTAANLNVKKIDQQTVELQLEPTRESPGHHYEAERSTNEKDWKKFETRAANAYTGSKVNRQYAFRDKIRADFPSPVIFYRVKLVDKNGRVGYTDVKKIYCANEFNVIKVHTSPLEKSIHIDFISGTDVKTVISLYDMSGKILSSSAMPVSKGINYFQYAPANQFVAGDYMLTIAQGANKFVTKVSKVN